MYYLHIPIITDFKFRINNGNAFLCICAYTDKIKVNWNALQYKQEFYSDKIGT